MNEDVALGVDGEISFAPACDVEEFACVDSGPAIGRFEDQGAFTAVFFQL
jgi:hypothetical protein